MRGRHFYLLNAGATTRQELYDQYYQRNHEKQMNKRTADVDRETKQPENDKHNTNGPKHKKKCIKVTT